MQLVSIALQGNGPAGMMNLAFFALMFGVIYFFFFRPQMKKQKEQTKFMDELEKGTEVVTASGIIGKISRIDGHVVQLQVDNKSFLRVTKSAISKEMTEAFAKGEDQK